MKAIEQYFHVVLFNSLYKMVLTFKSSHETLVYDHSKLLSSIFMWYCGSSIFFFFNSIFSQVYGHSNESLINLPYGMIVSFKLFLFIFAIFFIMSTVD